MIMITQAKKGDIPELIEAMRRADNRSKKWAELKATRFIDDKKGIRQLLVAKENKKILGYIGLKKEDEDNGAEKFISLHRYLCITWIAVLPEYRMRNVGSLLLKASERYARRFRKIGIELDCRERVIPFYEKNGYHVIGDFMKEGKKQFILIKHI